LRKKCVCLIVGFYAATRRYVFVVALAAPLFATYAFAQNTLALEWRVWLTRALMERYFRREVFYRLKRSGGTEVRDGGERAANESGATDEKNPPSVPFDVDTPFCVLCARTRRGSRRRARACLSRRWRRNCSRCARF
jgi:hypothetical protein